jgi:hypothetical protein
VAIRQPVERGLSKALVPRAATPSDLDEAQRDQLADCGRDRVTVEAELDEMLIGARELPVFLGIAAMTSQLDFKPSHCAVGRQAQGPVCRAFEHLD